MGEWIRLLSSSRPTAHTGNLVSWASVSPSDESSNNDFKQNYSMLRASLTNELFAPQVSVYPISLRDTAMNALAFTVLQSIKYLRKVERG